MSTVHIAWPRRRWPFKYRHETDNILYQDEEWTSLLPPSSPNHHGTHKFLPRWYFRPARLVILAMTITIGVAMIALGSSIYEQYNNSGGSSVEDDVINSRMSYILQHRPKLVVGADNYDASRTAPASTDLSMSLPCGISDIPLEDPVMQGCDVVSYFFLKEGLECAMGFSNVSVDVNGFKFWFSDPNTAELFESDPRMYAPVYGGFCSYAMATGGSGNDLASDAKVWHISDRGLQFFASNELKQLFLQDESNMLSKADEAWAILDASEAHPPGPFFNSYCFIGNMIRDNDLASTAAAAIWAGGDMKDDEDNRTTPFPIMMSAAESTSIFELSFLVSNKYTEILGPIGEEYPWTNDTNVIIDVVYPATITIMLNGDPILLEDQGTLYEYYLELDGILMSLVGIESNDNDTLILGYTTSFERPGSVNITVGRTPVEASNESTEEVSGVIMAKKVKREVRELLDEDWNIFLDALAILWTVPQLEGEDLYSKNFNSATTLLKWHASNAANRVQDFFHNGQGFLAQHIKIDMLVQKALRDIEASITVPYWDWTYDQYLVDEGLAHNVWEANTLLWSEDGFGSRSEDCADVDFEDMYNTNLIESCRIPDGRWADIKVPYKGDEQLPDDVADWFPQNSFGALRSPWNNIPSPYVTRLQRDDAVLPNCKTTFDFIEEYTDLAKFMTDIEHPLHAFIHQSIGGTFDQPSVWEEVNAIMMKMGEVMGAPETCVMGGNKSLPSVFLKNAWRAYYLEFPESCDPSSETLCLPICDDSMLINIGKLAMADCFDDDNPPTANASDEDYVALAELLCSSAIFKGDHFEASGTSDPSFFVLHGTLLRYYHYKQITSPLNGTWLSGADACTPRFGTCYSSFGVELDPEVCCQGHYEDSLAFTTVSDSFQEGWWSKWWLNVI